MAHAMPRKRLLCVGSRINGVWDIRHAGLSGGFPSFPPPEEAPPHANPYVWQRPGGESFPPSRPARSLHHTHSLKKGVHHERT